MELNYSDLSLKDIRYLIALSEHLHFGDAAEAVRVSQPALSKQIKEIEQILGLEIFERTKRSVRVTSRGESIISQAKVIASEAQKLISFAGEVVEPLSGKLKIGIIASSGPYLLPKILKPLKKRYPALELLVKEGYTEDLISDLKKTELDLLIAADTFEDSSITKFDLFFEPFLLAVSSRHVLASRKFVTEDDICPSEMIILEEGNCLSDQTWALCPVKNSNLDFIYQATSLETLYHMIAIGAGYSLVPQFSKSQNSTVNGLIKYLPFKKKSIGRNMILACRKTYPKKQDALLLQKLIKVYTGV